MRAAENCIRAKNSDKIAGGLSLQGACQIHAAEGDKKERRFSLVAYSGGPLEQGPMGWMYPVIVDLEGVDAGDGVLPMLDNHGPSGFSDVSTRNYLVGQSDKVEIKDRIGVEGKLFVESCPPAKDIAAKADEGFRWQASIGARSLAKDFIGEGSTVEVNGRTYEGPVYVSRKTILREVSFVVIGADPETSVVIASEKGKKIMAKKMSFAEYCKGKGHDDVDKLDEKMKAKLKADYEEEEEDDENEPKEGKTKAKGSVNIQGNGALDIEAERKRVVDEIRAAGAAETKRVAAIRKICAPQSGLQVPIEANGQTVQVDLESHAIEAGWDAQKTELEFLRAGRKSSAPGVPGGLGYSVNPPAMTDAVLEAAVLQAGRCELEDDSFYLDKDGSRRVPRRIQADTQREMRARYTDQIQQTAHTLFRGRIGLHQVLTAAAYANGYRGREVIDDGNLADVLRAAFRGDIRADGGASTVSIQNVLANVLNKFLLSGYLFAEQALREISATRPVKDFKPTKSVNVFGDFVYKKLNADGQIQNAAMTDEGFANQADTFARMLTLTRQTIINDDLNALTQVPQLMGIGAADALNILFWTVWLNGMGNGPDGAAFWATRTVAANALGGGGLNSNYISGGSSALSSAALQTAQQTYDKQVKPNGQPLGVDAEILLFPPELFTTAIELCESDLLIYGGASAAKQPAKNIWKGRFKPVKSRYLSNSTYTGNSATAWWLLAPPGKVPAIEIAFLNGQETPTVQTAQADFDTLGIKIRGFFDFGVAPQNTRGGIKSAGA